MAKTEVKSREQELQDAWIKYFKNVQKENDFLRLLIDYYKNYSESKILEFVESYDLYYTEKEIPKDIQAIPDEDLRRYFLSITTSIDNLFEEAKNVCENELEEAMAHFDKHTKAFYKLEKQTKELMPNYTQNRFESLSIKNFKGFSQENTIQIKPITLIYGPNSYGKSSIFQTLLLLHQTVKEGEDYRTISLLPNGNIVKLGSYRDFINNKDEKKVLKIELSLPFYNYSYNKYEHRDSAKNPYVLEKIFFDLNFSLKNNQIIMHEINLFSKQINYKNLNNPLESAKKLIYKFKLKQNKENNSSKNVLYNVEKQIDNFKDVEEYEKISYFTLDDYCGKNYQFEHLEQIIKDIIYVSSYRTPPERYYLPENNRRIYVGKTGEYTAEILSYDSKVNENVNIWLDKIAGYKLTLKKDGTVNSINLDDNKTEIKDINLLDLGSGIAQVLPVITQSFKSEREMILLEEPEIHLHPKAQAELGGMFADAIKKTGNTFIIETHSENLLLRLEKLIRRGELSKDDVSVIYVDKNENGSYCIPLKIDDEGDITNVNEIPDGFFEEGFNELFDINKEK